MYNDLKETWGFPGSPVVETLRFHCQGHRFDPWLAKFLLKELLQAGNTREEKDLQKQTQNRDFPVAVQWLRLHLPMQGVGSIPGWGANIPHALWPKNIKWKQYCKKFNKDFKNGPHKNILKKKTQNN